MNFNTQHQRKLAKLNSHSCLSFNTSLHNKDTFSNNKITHNQNQLHLSSLQYQMDFTKEVNINDIYTIMKKYNHKSIPINKQQHISYDNIYLCNRNVILDKIKATITKLKFTKNTYYLSIYFYDYIMSLYFEEIINENNKSSICKCPYKNDQIGLGCLFLAAKYCEKDPNVPTLKEIQMVFSTHVSYSNLKLRKIEVFCLQKLDYVLQRYTVFDFINFYIKCGIYNCYVNSNNNNESSTKVDVMALNKESVAIVDIFMKYSPNYLRFQSDKLALAIIEIVTNKYSKTLNTNNNNNHPDIISSILNDMRDNNLNEEINFIQCYYINNNNNSGNNNNNTKQYNLVKKIPIKNKQKSCNRSSSTSTSSGEINYNLQKIKEQSKLIKTNVYSLNSYLLDREHSGIKMNNSINQYKSDTYKLRLNLLKLSLNKAVSRNNFNQNQSKHFIQDKQKNWNSILFKQESHTKRESNDFIHHNLNTSDNNIKRNILNKTINNNNFMLSFDKSRNHFQDSMNNSHICGFSNNVNSSFNSSCNNNGSYHKIINQKKMFSSAIEIHKYNSTTKYKLLKEKRVLGSNKF